MPDIVYDDRLPGHETVDELLDTAEEIARELAHEHYDRTHQGEICGACVRNTPLDGEIGSWLGMKSSFDDLCEAVRDRVQEIDPADDAIWVDAELSGTYFDAFYEASVDPDGCRMCNSDDAYEDCGHEINGDPCPVTE